MAIEVVARSLYDKPEFKWRSTIKKWSEGESIFGSNSELLKCLQTSLDALEEMPILKQCYLDLGSFPEDERIPASALMDIWVELYNLDEDGVYTLDNLYELSTRNLANLVLTRYLSFVLVFIVIMFMHTNLCMSLMLRRVRCDCIYQEVEVA